MPLATEKLNRRSKKKQIGKAISSCIETLMSEYHDTGKIGNTTPDSEEHAKEIASGVCYSDARRHAGSAKVPRR